MTQLTNVKVAFILRMNYSSANQFTKLTGSVGLGRYCKKRKEQSLIWRVKYDEQRVDIPTRVLRKMARSREMSVLCSWLVYLRESVTVNNPYAFSGIKNLKIKINPYTFTQAQRQLKKGYRDPPSQNILSEAYPSSIIYHQQHQTWFCLEIIAPSLNLWIWSRGLWLHTNSQVCGLPSDSKSQLQPHQSMASISFKEAARSLFILGNTCSSDV